MPAKFRLTRGMIAPLGNIPHRGVAVEAPADQPLAEGVVYIAFTAPVTTTALDSSIDFITYPVNRSRSDGCDVRISAITVQP